MLKQADFFFLVERTSVSRDNPIYAGAFMNRQLLILLLTGNVSKRINNCLFCRRIFLIENGQLYEIMEKN
jgi:hypothetical protein